MESKNKELSPTEAVQKAMEILIEACWYIIKKENQTKCNNTILLLPEKAKSLQNTKQC